MKTATERPVLFSQEMVRAILAGKKTQTRRICKQVPTYLHFGRPIMEWGLSGVYFADGKWWLEVQTDVDDCSHDELICPYGQVGDRLWVRETWQQVQSIGRGQWETVRYPQKSSDAHVVYAADCTDEPPRWRPSIHMPRWASRLLLEITEVRVERIQKISNADCLMEGLAPTMRNEIAVKDRFRELWDKINGAGAWERNDFVWTISFKVINAQ